MSEKSDNVHPFALAKTAAKTEVELSPVSEAFIEACFVAYESARANLQKELTANGGKPPPGYKPPAPMTREQIKTQCLEQGLRSLLNALTGPEAGHFLVRGHVHGAHHVPDHGHNPLGLR